jgi:hypothetical protein
VRTGVGDDGVEGDEVAVDVGDDEHLHGRNDSRGRRFCPTRRGGLTPVFGVAGSLLSLGVAFSRKGCRILAVRRIMWQVSFGEYLPFGTIIVRHPCERQWMSRPRIAIVAYAELQSGGME